MKDTYRSSNFRISIDDSRPETTLKSKNDDLRFRRISRQHIVISVLLALILGVVALIGYLDINKRLSRIQGTGSMEVKGLSLTLDARLTALADKVSAHEKAILDIDKSVNKKIIPVEEILLNYENNNATINTTIKTMEKSIANLDSAIREERKNQEKAVAEMEKNLSPLTVALNKNETEIALIEEKLNRELILIAESMAAAKKDMEKPHQDIDLIKTDIGHIKTELTAVSSGDIYKQVIEITLKKQQRQYEERLDLMRSELELITKSLASLQKRLEAAERDLKAQKTLPPPPDVTSRKPPPAKPITKGSETESGIIEKDIE